MHRIEDSIYCLEHLDHNAFFYLAVIDYVNEVASVCPVVHSLIELEIKTLLEVLLLIDLVCFLQRNQLLSLTDDKTVCFLETLRVHLDALRLVIRCLLLVVEQTNDREHLLISQLA